MRRGQRIRLIMLIALLTILLFNFPILKIADFQRIQDIPVTAPFLFIIWGAAIFFCWLVVGRRRR